MKDSRFIELLNLYVDREITPTEVVELETEVHRSPERRQVFNQYGQMDRACSIVLSQNTAAPAPKLAAALVDAARKIVGYPTESVGYSKLVFIGGLMAAAAALAIVFVNSANAPAVHPGPDEQQPQIAKVPSSGPVPTDRAKTVVFGGTTAPDVGVRSSLAWLAKMELSRTTSVSDEDLKLVPRAEKSFSSGLTWGLRRDYGAFPKAGVTRSPTELNAYELHK